MRNFRIHDLVGWEPVTLGTPIADEGGPERRILMFRVIANAMVSVFASDDLADNRLVAYGDGVMRVRVAVSGVAEFMVTSETDGAVVFVSRRSEPQVVPDKQQASFAVIEPKGAGVSLEVKRMQLWMRLNEQRREAVLSAERARLRDIADEFVKAAKSGAPSAAATAAAPGAAKAAKSSPADEPAAD